MRLRWCLWEWRIDGLRKSARGESKKGENLIHSYPWYMQEWFGSDSRASLNGEEKGLFRELLDHLYNDGGSLPNDLEILRRKTQFTEKEWKRSWPKVRQRFYESEGRLRNSTADRVLAKLTDYHERRSAAGKRGAEKVHGKRRAEPDQKYGGAVAEPLAEPQLEHGLPQPHLNPSHISTTSQPQPLPQPSAVLEGEFLEFRRLANERDVLRASDQDWKWALYAWRALDVDARHKALSDLGGRPEDSPEMRSLPANYLKERKFDRPLPKIQVRESAAQERLRNA